MSTLSRGFHWCVAGVCAYETVAIVTDAAPTVSHLCHRRRWLTALILGGLAVHLVKGPLTR